MSTTKSEIAAFTLGLVARKSFSSFSYDDISRQFNMTKAAVHYHFKSKEDLGVAICELMRDRILESRPGEIEAAKSGRHPWKYIESRFKELPPNGICPIVSMQADFENLPEHLRAALVELTTVEMDTFRLLAHAYNSKADKEAIVPLLLAMKGALQYRRVMGDDFFKKAIKRIKTQFYEAIPNRS